MHLLYGFKGSGSAAIEMALRAADIPFRIIEVASWEEATPIAELDRLNPLRQIPTLKLPDGTTLTESAAILIHLGLEYPDAGLLPADPRRRARAIQGLVYVAATCYSAVGIIDYPERWTSGTSEVELENVRMGSRQRLHRNWEIFADLFFGDSPLISERPGSLEYLVVTVSRWLGTRAHLREHRPRFCKLLEALERHPAIAPIVAQHWPDE
jgi:GST-like protein